MEITKDQLTARINELRETQQKCRAQEKQMEANANACEGAIIECQRMLKELMDEERDAEIVEPTVEERPIPVEE